MIKFWSYLAEYKDIRKQLLRSIDTTIKGGYIFFGRELENEKQAKSFWE